MPFTRSRLVPPRPLTLDQVPVPYSTEARYLGLTLDSKLFWTQHIHWKTANGKRLLLALLNAVSQNWGPSPRLSRWIYSGIVRPMITYCSVVWYHKAAANRDGLAQLDQLALFSITRQQRSAPTRGLAVALGVVPLDLHLRRASILMAA